MPDATPPSEWISPSEAAAGNPEVSRAHADSRVRQATQTTTKLCLRYGFRSLNTNLSMSTVLGVGFTSIINSQGYTGISLLNIAAPILESGFNQNADFAKPTMHALNPKPGTPKTTEP